MMKLSSGINEFLRSWMRIGTNSVEEEIDTSPGRRQLPEPFPPACSDYDRSDS